MISGRTLDALLLDLDGGLDDGADLHVADLGELDRQPAAAEAQHRVGLVQLLDALLDLLDRDAQVAGPPRPGRRRRAAGTRARGGRAGGSSPGKPAIASKMPTKSSFWIGLELGQGGFLRPSRSSARIIFLMSTIRWPSKNMCSVRQRPIPSAPNSRALAASLGASALVRTLRVRTLSAQPMSVAKSPESWSGRRSAPGRSSRRRSCR